MGLAYEGLKKTTCLAAPWAGAGYEHDSSYSGGLEFYIERGYVPTRSRRRTRAFHQDGAGQTWNMPTRLTLAQLAEALGKRQDAEYFLRRSQNYKTCLM